MANSGNSSNNYHQNQSNPRTFHSKLKNRRPDLTSDRSTENSTGSLRQTRDLRQTRLSSTDRLLRIRGSDNQASSSNQLLESYSEFRSNRELKNRSRASLPNLSDVRADPKDKGKLEDVKQGASSSDSTQTTPTKLITLKERDRNDSFQESCLPLGLDIETQCSPLAYQLIHPVQKIQTLNRSHGGWIEHQNQQQPPQETAAHRDISKDLKNLSDDDPNNPFNVQEEAPSNVIKTKKNQQTKFPTPLNDLRLIQPKEYIDQPNPSTSPTPLEGQTFLLKDHQNRTSYPETQNQMVCSPSQQSIDEDQEADPDSILLPLKKTSKRHLLLFRESFGGEEEEQQEEEDEEEEGAHCLQPESKLFDPCPDKAFNKSANLANQSPTQELFLKTHLISRPINSPIRQPSDRILVNDSQDSPTRSISSSAETSPTKTPLPSRSLAPPTPISKRIQTNRSFILNSSFSNRSTLSKSLNRLSNISLQNPTATPSSIHPSPRSNVVLGSQLMITENSGHRRRQPGGIDRRISEAWRADPSKAQIINKKPPRQINIKQFLTVSQVIKGRDGPEKSFDEGEIEYQRGLIKDLLGQSSLFGKAKGGEDQRISCGEDGEDEISLDEEGDDDVAVAVPIPNKHQGEELEIVPDSNDDVCDLEEENEKLYRRKQTRITSFIRTDGNDDLRVSRGVTEGLEALSPKEPDRLIDEFYQLIDRKTFRTNHYRRHKKPNPRPSPSSFEDYRTTTNKKLKLTNSYDELTVDDDHGSSSKINESQLKEASRDRPQMHRSKTIDISTLDAWASTGSIFLSNSSCESDRGTELEITTQDLEERSKEIFL